MTLPCPVLLTVPENTILSGRFGGVSWPRFSQITRILTELPVPLFSVPDVGNLLHFSQGLRKLSEVEFCGSE